MSHYSRSNDARMTTRINAATAARAVSAPVCADDDCMQCAMGLDCPNAPKATAKPRVRVCLSWTAERLENEMLRALLPTPDYIAEIRAEYVGSSITATAHAMASKQFADNAEMIWRSRNPRPQGNSATTRKRQAEYDRKTPAAIAAVRAEALS